MLSVPLARLCKYVAESPSLMVGRLLAQAMIRLDVVTHLLLRRM